MIALLIALACTPPQRDIIDLVPLLEKDGGKIIGFLEVPGVGFDHILVAEFNGMIVVSPMQGQCVSEGFAPIGLATPKPPGTGV